MKKIIITLLCLAVFSPASFGFASFDGVKTSEYLNKYLSQKLKEAKDKEDEKNDFAFAAWNYDLQKYAEEFRSEISLMGVRVQSKFIISEKYQRLAASNEQEKTNFTSAVNYFSTIYQFSKMNDAQVLFYAITLYDVNHMDASHKKQAEKYLEDNDKRFKSFNEKKAFADQKERAKLTYVMARIKKVNRILGETSSGDGGDFINFCALLSQVFK